MLMEPPGRAPIAMRLRAGVGGRRQVAARAIAAGQMLAAEDVRDEAHVRWGPPASGPVPTVEAGWVARRRMVPGAVLDAAHVGPAPVVSAGQAVRVLWNEGSVTVALEAVALHDAVLGAPLRVRTIRKRGRAADHRDRARRSEDELMRHACNHPAAGRGRAGARRPRQPRRGRLPLRHRHRPATRRAERPTGVSRAGWFSDKRPLRIGDIVTIVVDETVNAHERQSENASKKRSNEMGLNLNVGTDLAIGPQKGFQSGLGQDSRAGGEARRTGDLSAMISVRVVSIEPTGMARLKGEKTVGVDGRNQVIQVEGVVRPEDVTSQNTVASSRIAESVITYKGKKIGPAKGILGSILSIFWP